MVFNLWIIMAAALVPLLIGFVWYHPKVFGNAWMKASGMTEEKAKSANFILIFALTYILSFMAASVLVSMVIHQNSVYSVFQGDEGINNPDSEVSKYLSDFSQAHGNKFRTFKHGALHGVLGGIFLAFPLIGVIALFEAKGAKYIFINAGFWTFCMAIMGGIICAFS